jgi:hypothetical protein
MNALPVDSPEILVTLLSQWHNISLDHKPTKADFPFDALVMNHPGLLWAEKTDESDLDLRFIKTGPEIIRRFGIRSPGAIGSETMSPSDFTNLPGNFGDCLISGRPHYLDFTSSNYGEAPMQYRRLMLPLFDRQGIATSLLGSYVWVDDYPT